MDLGVQDIGKLGIQLLSLLTVHEDACQDDAEVERPLCSPDDLLPCAQITPFHSSIVTNNGYLLSLGTTGPGKGTLGSPSASVCPHKDRGVLRRPRVKRQQP